MRILPALREGKERQCREGARARIKDDHRQEQATTDAPEGAMLGTPVVQLPDAEAHLRHPLEVVQVALKSVHHGTD
eukprot:1143803-Pelagomonas_calceolata.AAC.5